MPFPVLLAIQLGITAGAWGLNWLYKKTHQRPFPKPRPEGLEFAQATIGSSLPLVYGTIRVNEPVMTWHGNHDSVELTTSGRPGTFAYKADLLYVAGVPSWDEAAAPYSNWRTTNPPKLLGFWYGDVHPSTGPLAHGASYGAAVTIGDGVDMVGTIEFHDGRASQTLGTWTLACLAAAGVAPTLTPAFRHQMLVLLSTSTSSGQIGSSPQVPVLGLEVQSLGPQPIGQDANPAWVIYDLMCSPVWKMGIDPDDIDLASFTAAASTLLTEEHGCSIAIYQKEDAVSVISTLLEQIDATLFEDPATSTIKIKLIRAADAVVVDLDESNTVGRPRIDVMGWHEVATQIDVGFTNRLREYQRDSVSAGRLANAVGARNRRHPRVLEYPGVTNAALAKKIAARDLSVLGRPLLAGSATLKRECSHLLPGDPILANWTSSRITSKRFRILTIDLGQRADGAIEVTLVEDVFDQTAGAFPGSDATLLVPFLLPLHERYPTEAPYWMMLWLYNYGLISSPDVQRLFAVAVNDDDATATSFSVLGENLIVPGTFYTDVAGSSTFLQYATVATDYPRTAEPYDTTLGLEIEDISTAAQVRLDTYTTTPTAGDIANNGYHLCMLLDPDTGAHEFIAFETYSAGVLHNVWRGLLDTAARDWPAGSRFLLLNTQWINHVGAVGRSADTIVQFVPSGGVLSGSGDDPLDTVEVIGRGANPLPCADFGIAGPLVEGTEGIPATGYLKEVSHLDADFRFEAAPRARSATSITRGDAGHHSIESGNTFDLIAEKQNEGEDPEAEVAIASGLATTLLGGYLLGAAGHGEIDVRLRTKNAARSSWTDPTIRVTAPGWRNLLANPSATSSFGAAAVNGWDNVTGTVQASTGTSSLSRSATGNYFTSATASGSVTAFRQTVDVSGYPARGMSAIVDFYYRNLASDADDTITVLVEALDAASGSLSSSSTSGALVGSTTLWKRATVTIAAMPALTAKVRVTVTMTGVSEAAPSTALSEISLRLGQVGSQLLSNPTFDAAIVTPSIVSVTALSSSTGANTVAWGTHASGDQAYLCIEHPVTCANISLSTPAGFVFFSRVTPATGRELTIYHQEATSSSMASPVIAAATPGDAEPVHASAVMIVVRNAGTTDHGGLTGTTKWNASASDTSTTTSTVTIPTATTTKVTCLVVGIVAFVNDANSTTNLDTWTNANLTSITEWADASHNLGDGGGLGVVAGVKATAGAVGATTAVLANTSPQARFVLAFNPVGL